MSAVAQSGAVVAEPGVFMTHFIGALNIPGPVKWTLYLVETNFWLGRKIRNWIFMSENPHLCVFGAFLNDHAGKNSFVRVVAQVVHLARIITEFNIKADNFVQSITRFKNACLIQPLELSYLGTELSREWNYVQGDAPHYFKLPWPVSYAGAKIHQIFNRIIALLYAAYQVSYTLFELREAISLNLGEDSVESLPMEIQRLVEGFSGDNQSLRAVLLEHEEVIDQIFTTAFVPWTTQRLASTLDRFSAGAGVVNLLVVQGPSYVSNEVAHVVPKSSKPWEQQHV